MNAQGPSERLAVIVNPKAGAGRAGKALPELRALLASRAEGATILVTERPGHATELTRQALREGYGLIAAVGGDGTCSEVVNGFWADEAESAEPLAPDAVFTVLPCGTGSDLIRSLRIPRETPAALEVALAGETRRLDLAMTSFLGYEGSSVRRRCVNVTGFGANGEVVRRANASSKKLGGRITFLQATLSTLLAYRPPRLRIDWQGREEKGTWTGEVMTAFVGNGHYCGGGMWIGKGGAMDDGLLDLAVIPPAGLLRSAMDLPRLYDGDLHRVPGVFQARILQIDARRDDADGGPVRVDVDGEQLGTLPFSVKVLPSALRVRGGWMRESAGFKA